MYYTKDSILFLDGKFLKVGDAHIDPFSQTLHYGYGVFEGIRAYQTLNGVKIFKAQEHFERLRHSCDLLGIPLHYTTEELVQIAYQLLRKNNLSNAYIRPLVYCSPNMTLTQPKESFLLMCVWEWEKYHGDKRLKLCISGYQRPNPNAWKLEGKIIGQYVNSILATTEAKQRGFDDGLLLDINGNVGQSPAANFFMEKDGHLYTPPLGHITPGITRQTVISICRELEIPVTERHIKPEELETADSAFLCGTAAEIAPIESIDAKPFKKDWNDSLGTTIYEAYKCQVREKSFTYVII